MVSFLKTTKKNSCIEKHLHVRSLHTEQWVGAKALLPLIKLKKNNIYLYIYTHRVQGRTSRGKKIPKISRKMLSSSPRIPSCLLVGLALHWLSANWVWAPLASQGGERGELGRGRRVFLLQRRRGLRKPRVGLMVTKTGTRCTGEVQPQEMPQKTILEPGG